MLLLEWWRPVAGYNTYYEVSNAGNVRRVLFRSKKPLARSIGPYLSSSPNLAGYPRVTLMDNGKTKHVLVHRLVANAFLGECPPGLEVNHIDNNRKRPVVSNLEYVDHPKNVTLARDYSERTRGTRCAGDLNRETARLIMSLKGLKEASDLATMFGVKIRTIWAIWRGDSYGWANGIDPKITPRQKYIKSGKHVGQYARYSRSPARS